MPAITPFRQYGFALEPHATSRKTAAVAAEAHVPGATGR